MSTTPSRLLPLATTTALPGIGQCEDYEGLLAALSSGSKQILAGRSIGELAAMLPIPHKSDVLQLVAEGRLVHGEKAATDLAHAIPLAIIAGLGHLMMGNVNPTLLANLLLGSIPGVLVGSWISTRAPMQWVRVGLAIILAAVASKMMLT